jgi:hypothetical protein
MLFFSKKKYMGAVELYVKENIISADYIFSDTYFIYRSNDRIVNKEKIDLENENVKTFF